MEKERLDEYKDSVEEAGIYPEELNTMEVRLKKRIRHRKMKICIRGVELTTVLFVLFILAVNTSTVMAEAIFKIPVLGTLAEYVSFDKGLQNAIKNEYAQEVDLTGENNGYTLGLPYVIADSRRLVVFFQIPENAIGQERASFYINIDKIVDATTGKEFDEYTSQNSGYTTSEKDGGSGLLYNSIRSVDKAIPQDLKIYVTLNRDILSNNDNIATTPSKDRFDFSTDTKPEKLGIYVFDLHLKDYPKPKNIILNQEIKVMDQTIRINSITQYPTGTEVNIYIPDSNQYIINGLNLKAIDTKGNEMDNSGGVISMGPDSNNESIYYLASDYFSSASLDRIQIRGIRLIKKSEAVITIDMQKKTMTPEISGLRIKSIDQDGEMANLIFEMDSSDCFTLFAREYLDTAGNKNEIGYEGISSEDEKAEIYFSVVWPEDNKVILTRSMSPMIELEKPVEIDLKN